MNSLIASFTKIISSQKFCFFSFNFVIWSCFFSSFLYNIILLFFDFLFSQVWLIFSIGIPLSERSNQGVNCPSHLQKKIDSEQSILGHKQCTWYAIRTSTNYSFVLLLPFFLFSSSVLPLLFFLSSSSLLLVLFFLFHSCSSHFSHRKAAHEYCCFAARTSTPRTTPTRPRTTLPS